MTCKTPNCNNPTVGNSSYCCQHRTEAYKRWREIIAQQKEEKENRDKKFQELWEKGCEAGRASAASSQIQMIFLSNTPPFPICGFAWVNVAPANCSFANWLKKNGHGKTDHFSGGVCVWINEYGQSCDLKYAFAKGMAKVFADAGIKAVAGSRLD